MTNDLTLIDIVAKNIKTVIVNLNNDYSVKLYDTVLNMVRGKFGFNVLPVEFKTREFTDVSSLPDIMLEMFCYYTLDSEEEREKKWTDYLSALNAIRNALLTKTNIPSPLATVKIDMNFHDDLLDMKTKNRAINGYMSFTYKKYAHNY